MPPALPPYGPAGPLTRVRNPGLTCGIPWNRTADLLPMRDQVSGTPRNCPPICPPEQNRSAVPHANKPLTCEPPYGIEP